MPRNQQVITSFVLRPLDGDAVIGHRPGQYLTLRLAQPGGVALRRNYSISSAANGFDYRISVKREPHGAASRWLHDHVREGDIINVTPPAGDFFLPDAPQRPVVLLSGGVGLTPMVSMVETIVHRHPGLETHFVHGALNSETHALDSHVRQLAAGHGAMSVTVFYSNPDKRDVVGKSHDRDGFVTLEWLVANTPLANADVYLCGPRQFLRTLVGGLSLAGVSPDRIHHEFFGPADELLAA